jgi:hypothetical protein
MQTLKIKLKVKHNGAPGLNHDTMKTCGIRQVKLHAFLNKRLLPVHSSETDHSSHWIAGRSGHRAGLDALEMRKVPAPGGN